MRFVPAYVEKTLKIIKGPLSYYYENEIQRTMKNWIIDCLNFTVLMAGREAPGLVFIQIKSLKETLFQEDLMDLLRGRSSLRLAQEGLFVWYGSGIDLWYNVS